MLNKVRKFELWSNATVQMVVGSAPVVVVDMTLQCYSGTTTL